MNNNHICSPEEILLHLGTHFVRPMYCQKLTCSAVWCKSCQVAVAFKIFLFRRGVLCRL